MTGGGGAGGGECAKRGGIGRGGARVNRLGANLRGWRRRRGPACELLQSLRRKAGGFGCRSCQATEVSRRRGPLSLTLAHTSHPARGRRGRRSLASRGDRGVEAARARTRHLTRVSQLLLNLYRSNLMRVRPPTHAHPASARVEQQQLEKSRSPPASHSSSYTCSRCAQTAPRLRKRTRGPPCTLTARSGLPCDEGS